MEAMAYLMLRVNRGQIKIVDFVEEHYTIIEQEETAVGLET